MPDEDVHALAEVRVQVPQDLGGGSEGGNAVVQKLLSEVLQSALKGV